MAYAYLLTPSGVAEKAALTSRFLRFKMEEYELLKAEIELLQDETLEVVDQNISANLGYE